MNGFLWRTCLRLCRDGMRSLEPLCSPRNALDILESFAWHELEPVIAVCRDSGINGSISRVIGGKSLLVIAAELLGFARHILRSRRQGCDRVCWVQRGGEPCCCGWHELSDADRSRRGNGIGVIAAFHLDLLLE